MTMLALIFATWSNLSLGGCGYLLTVSTQWTWVWFLFCSVLFCAAVLYNLQVRFCERNYIYTYCGKLIMILRWSIATLCVHSFTHCLFNKMCSRCAFCLYILQDAILITRKLLQLQHCSIITLHSWPKAQTLFQFFSQQFTATLYSSRKVWKRKTTRGVKTTK